MSKSELKQKDVTNYSLGKELVLWFLAVSVVPLIILAWFSYQQAADTLRNNALDRLDESSELKIRSVHNWFDYRLMDLSSQAEYQFNARLLKLFSNDFNKNKQSIEEYVKSESWAEIGNGYGGDLNNFAARYDYVYDLYLIDQHGNILYSVAKETDLGKNLLTGSYNKTKFSVAVKEALLSGQSVFSGLERYAPSNNNLSSFLTAPLLDVSGKNLGVIAIQLRMDSFFDILKTHNTSSKTERHYLITQQGQLVTPIINQWDEVLNRNISASIKIQEDSEEIRTGISEYTNAFNKRVFGTRSSLNVLNVNWILISEIDTEYALNSSNTVANVTLLLLLLTIALVLIVSLFIARKITHPISVLAEASMKVAAGKNDHFVDIPSRNEIGCLAEAFNHMLKVRQKHGKALEKSVLKTEKALIKLKEQKFALDQHSIVAITDIRGTITFVNEKFCEISGYSKKELIGNNHRLLNSGVHDISFFKNMYRTIVKDGVWHAEICNKAKDGSLYWVDTTIVSTTGDNNKPESYIAIRTDITERVKTSKELAKSKEKAEMALLAKSEFLASMSHEIRTPMNGVLGMLSLLLNTKLTKDQQHRIKIAQTSAQSLLTLINDILDFSKIDAGKLTLEHIDFNLRAMLGEFSEAMSYFAQIKGLELILDTKNIEESQVKGDPSRLRQILTNIVSNAIKFTPEGEVVVIAKLNAIDDHLFQFDCTITDTGIGIPSDKTSKLFNSFSQVDASTTRKFGGTGLGLAIVKKLCELMQGGISVTSEIDKGSCFQVKIQLEKSKLSRQVMPQVDMAKLSILVVDDNKTNRKVLEDQLSYWGANVVTVDSGQAALNICEEHVKQERDLFDIAFLDMQMPEMDGADLSKKLKSNSHFKEIKLIMMTSLGHKGDARYFADLGFSGYFPKPATTSDLFDALSIVASGGAALEQAQPLVTSHYLKTMLHSNAYDAKQFGSSLSKTIRILLVEDNDVNQIVATGVLNDYGIENIDIAGNGIEAIEKLLQTPQGSTYSLILMDCQMPEMDGYVASSKIRAGDAGEHLNTIPIIAMTANAMIGDRDKCLQAGMSDYISKPIDPDILISKVIQWTKNTKNIIEVQNEENQQSVLSENNSTISQNNSTEKELIIWDEAALLKRLRGNEKLLRKMVNLFINGCDASLEELEQAIADDNLERIRFIAHTMKGTTANLSGLQVQNIAKLIEYAARENNMIEIKSLLPVTIENNKKLKQALQEYMSDSMTHVEPQKLVIDHQDLIQHLVLFKSKLEKNEFVDQEELEWLIPVNFEKVVHPLVQKLLEQTDLFQTDAAISTIDDILAEVNTDPKIAKH